MANNKTTKTDIYKIDPRNIVVTKDFNSRCNFGDLDELARQIKEQGVLNPISVQPFKDENGEEKYRLIDGERRYRAVMKLIDEGEEIARVPALFLSKSCTEEELLIQQALRNEGKNFNEYEWALLARKLQDRCGLTKSEIAKKLGKNPGMVSYWLQLLELKPELQGLIRDGVITAVDVRKMLQANNHDEEIVYKEIIKAQKNNANEGKNPNKISLKNLDINSRTIAFKDSKNIKFGLRTLFKYIDQYNNPDGQFEAEINLREVLEQLNQDMTITEILDNIKKNAYAQAE
jgi:ParB family chromosome partitioning protein